LSANSFESVFTSAKTEARKTLNRAKFAIGSLTEEGVIMAMLPPLRSIIEGSARATRITLKPFCHAASSREIALPGKRPTRVSDQWVNAAKTLDGGAMPVCDRFCPLHIRRDSQDARAGRLLRSFRRVAAGSGCARGYGNHRPLGRQRFGRRIAQTAARSRYRRDLSFQS
jgi:hypothetical protein